MGSTRVTTRPAVPLPAAQQALDLVAAHARRGQHEAVEAGTWLAAIEAQRVWAGAEVKDPIEFGHRPARQRVLGAGVPADGLDLVARGAEAGENAVPREFRRQAQVLLGGGAAGGC